MEENLSLPEVEQILDAQRTKEKAHQKFTAALKGIDLDKGDTDSNTDFEAVKRRAAAKLRGISEEMIELADIGITIIDDDEGEVN